MNTFYAVKIDDDIKFIIPWEEGATIPSLIDVAQTLSYVWGTTGTDLGFGPTIDITEVDVAEKKSENKA